MKKNVVKRAHRAPRAEAFLLIIFLNLSRMVLTQREEFRRLRILTLFELFPTIKSNVVMG
jgi:hypothetical protein